MSLIAFTTDLTTSVLVGNGKGVIITPISEEDFLKELSSPNFRGFYSARISCLDHYFEYLRKSVPSNIMDAVRTIDKVFTWTEEHDAVYSMEPCPNPDGSIQAITFFKVEKVKNDYISES